MTIWVWWHDPNGKEGWRTKSGLSRTLTVRSEPCSAAPRLKPPGKSPWGCPHKGRWRKFKEVEEAPK